MTSDTLGVVRVVFERYIIQLYSNENKRDDYGTRPWRIVKYVTMQSVDPLSSSVQSTPPETRKTTVKQFIETQFSPTAAKQSVLRENNTKLITIVRVHYDVVVCRFVWLRTIRTNVSRTECYEWNYLTASEIFAICWQTRFDGSPPTPNQPKTMVLIEFRDTKPFYPPFISAHYSHRFNSSQETDSRRHIYRRSPPLIRTMYVYVSGCSYGM